MDAVGAEVGQKMRSAIKAKLTELECYVDDELPDYIMVMVANKRSKSQMNDDLNLFLSNKTSTFVDWLHIVLKKLKEVTVTNAEVYKKATKRKSNGQIEDVKVKKEKKTKKQEKLDVEVKKEASSVKSLTDDLPINIKNRLIDSRKIILSSNKNNDDGFDIPLLSDVESKTKELKDIERQIKNVKSRLGDLVRSDDEDETVLRIKAEKNLFLFKESNRRIQIQENVLLTDTNKNTDTDIIENSSEVEPKKSERKLITFSNNDKVKTPPRKRESVLSRLGRRTSINMKNDESPDRRLKKNETNEDIRNRLNRNAKRRKDGEKQNILSRLGVMSKVSIPEKPQEKEEIIKEVKSMVTVKPRTIPPNTQQANKNLILKAVAEAQRSIAQTPNVGIKIHKNALFTKKYMADKHGTKLIPEQTKKKLRNILVALGDSKKSYRGSDEDEMEYIPKPVKKANLGQFSPTYTPTSPTDCTNFVVKINSNMEEKQNSGKRSPIVFDVKSGPGSKPNIPDKLPFVSTSNLLKKQEPCMYFPNCRMGDKCEYQHFRKTCEIFPHCKFGDKCLYTHPSCKFGVSCTRKDCIYSHAKGTKQSVAALSTPGKPCKFGKFCKNNNCLFNHSFSSLHRKLRS